MKKPNLFKLFVILFIFNLIQFDNANAANRINNDSCTVVYIKNVKGYILNGKYFLMTIKFLDNSQENKHWNPTIKDISLIEKKINKAIDRKYSKDFPVRKDFNKYIRQYLGFYNKEGEKIVLVNFVIAGYVKEQIFTKQLIGVFDGGLAQFQIYFNFEKRIILNELNFKLY